jgi:hypothetical protein
MGHWALQRGMVTEDKADCFNDDRIGRTLDRLFNSDNPEWQEALLLPNTHDKDGPTRLFWTYDSSFLSSEGFRIVWVKSSANQFENDQRRTQRIVRSQEALAELR